MDRRGVGGITGCASAQGAASQRIRTVEQRRVQHREAGRGDPRRADQRQRRALHDDGDVVRVREPPVGPGATSGPPGQHDDPRAPAAAQRGDAPPAQPVGRDHHREHRVAQRRDERPVLRHVGSTTQPASSAACSATMTGKCPRPDSAPPSRSSAVRVPRGHHQLGHPLARDDGEQHPEHVQSSLRSSPSHSAPRRHRQRCCHPHQLSRTSSALTPGPRPIISPNDPRQVAGKTGSPAAGCRAPRPRTGCRPARATGGLAPWPIRAA